MSDSTIQYYNKNANTYFESTVGLDLSTLYGPFLKHLSPGAHILDAGCGSGRDSLFFKNQGFQVTAFDASEEMVKLSSQLLGQEVLLMTFEDLDLPDQYDGIWACASLLHVPRLKLPMLIAQLANNLRAGGVFYMSFKYGSDEFWRDGRYFNCLEEDSLQGIIGQIPALRIDRLSTSVDVRQGRESEQWLNACLLKA